MPAIETAEDAVDAAEKFLSKYHGTRILHRVEKYAGNWRVDFDVAIIGKAIVHITVDAETGKVIEYKKDETVA